MIGIVAPVLAVEELVEARGGQIHRLCFHPAGQGVNVARAIRELGEECTIVGFNGGETGVVVRSLLDAYGFTHHLVPVPGETAAIVKVTTGYLEQEVYRLPPPVVSRHESDDLYSAASLLIMECPVVVFSTHLLDGMPPDFFVRLTRLAHRYQAKIIADLPAELLKQVVAVGPTVIKPNVDQLRQLYELRADPTDEDLLSVAADLQHRGARSIALSLGENGALIVDNRDAWRLIPPAVEAVAEAGAGDCMTGGIAVGLSRGQPFLEAAALGVAAGCAKVMRHGLGTCKRDVTHGLLERVQINRLRRGPCQEAA